MAARNNNKMGRRVLALLVLLCSFAYGAATASAAETGFSIRDGRLLDAYGNDFVMRGVNHPHSWFEAETGALADIKAAGANTVRIVLSTGARFNRTQPQAVAALISRCRQTQLVCVLEVHDTTGYPGVEGSISLDAAVDFWISLNDVLHGHEAFVIVNLGNEPFDNERFDEWTGATQAAVQRMRDHGFSHTLMVDAPNWGQDWSFTMRDNASAVFESDPHRNLIFDVHMYGVFDTAAKVRSYIESFVRAGLPLVIGEFGATHTDGDPDEAAIMHWAAMYGIGYLAWSWSGNTFPVAELNLVHSFDASARTAWGSRLFDGQWGINATAIEATVFGAPVTATPPLLAQLPSVPQQVPPEPPKLPIVITQSEAEQAVRNGLSVSMRGAGYSGAGFLTGFDAKGDSVTMTVHVETAGRYDVVFGYRSIFGDKTQQITVNGRRLGGLTFPEADTFEMVSLRNIELTHGENRIAVTHDWGWLDLDYVQVRTVDR